MREAGIGLVPTGGEIGEIFKSLQRLGDHTQQRYVAPSSKCGPVFSSWTSGTIGGRVGGPLVYAWGIDILLGAIEKGSSWQDIATMRSRFGSCRLAST